MSTQAPAPTPTAVPTPVREIRVLGHSNLFFWWPIWTLGFLLTFLTWWDNSRLAVVPPNSKLTALSVPREAAGEKRFELTFSGSVPDSLHEAANPPQGQSAFPIRIAESKNYGVLFIVTLLLVIFITSLPVQGIWSKVLIALLILLAVVLTATSSWKYLMTWLGVLDIHINLAGYFFTSLVLFGFWLLSLFIFDRHRYAVFTPSEIQIHQDFATVRLTYESQPTIKVRNDIFRHWILGMGTSDLIIEVKTPDGKTQQFELLNVLFAGKKLHHIQEVVNKR